MTLDSEENDIILENINEYKESILETYVQQKCDKSQSLRWGTCRTTNAIAELVDVFPTIADLAGVPIPLCQTSNVNNKYHRSRDDDFAYHKKTPDLCSEGITLLPLIKNIVRCQVSKLCFAFYILDNLCNYFISNNYIYIYKFFLFFHIYNNLEHTVEEGGIQSVPETWNPTHPSSQQR